MSVKIRRALTAAATLVATIAIALAVPVAQLRTFHVDVKCCCPDPDHCHCPPDKKHDRGGASLNICHHSDNVVVAPQVPSFAAPAVPAAREPARALVAIELAVDQPHSAPAPRRPDAPS